MGKADGQNVENFIFHIIAHNLAHTSPTGAGFILQQLVNFRRSTTCLFSYRFVLQMNSILERIVETP